jgi:2,3,4,5-tetrahydropyridine-2-carboxylate N-succinyltransferase
MGGDLKNWVTHGWVKQAILMAFRMRTSEFQPPFYYDKLSVFPNREDTTVRRVPGSFLREGAFAAGGTILMPSFVNIGAWVGPGTMVDTWATVGSCAQIGQGVHLSGGVGIGGVLEPVMARPVMIGDGAFIGSRAIVVEGCIVERGAILGANVCLTSSTPIYDMTQENPVEYRGFVPERAIVAPGTRPKTLPGGTVQLQCAYIIGYRSESTDLKVSLNDALRETGIAI